MKWGFNKSLNEKVDLHKTREQEGFMLLKYTLKEVSKIWDKAVSDYYYKGHPDAYNRVGIALNEIDRVFILYLDNKATKGEFKRKLEVLYQMVLKVRNLTRSNNNKQMEYKI